MSVSFSNRSQHHVKVVLRLCTEAGQQRGSREGRWQGGSDSASLMQTPNDISFPLGAACTLLGSPEPVCALCTSPAGPADQRLGKGEDDLESPQPRGTLVPWAVLGGAHLSSPDLALLPQWGCNMEEGPSSFQTPPPDTRLQ